MKVASWNVNSIRARLPALTRWLDEAQPDVLMLQETKVVDDDFPRDELTRRGYCVAFAGQKSYNGVAILSQSPLSDVSIGFSADSTSSDKRLIAATTQDMRILCAYVPNGKDVTNVAFQQKLDFLEQLRAHVEQQRAQFGKPIVLGGDFNVAHEPRDVWSPSLFEGQLHFHPSERKALTRLLDAGVFDSFRRFVPDAERYSWWDYRGTSLAKNRGLRIDYLFLDRTIADRCLAAGIDANPRYWDKPSDHVPVWLELGPAAPGAS